MSGALRGGQREGPPRSPEASASAPEERRHGQRACVAAVSGDEDRKDYRAGTFGVLKAMEG